jgi:hypothetical protein
MNDNLRGRIPADVTGAIDSIRNAHERVFMATIAVRRGGRNDKKACGLCGLRRRRQNEKHQETEERPCEADLPCVQISLSHDFSFPFAV